MGLFERLKRQKEKEKKSIPSKVFFNHFYSITYFISCCDERYELKKIGYYNKIKIRNKDLDLNEIRKLLWNSWSTEYAYKIGEKIDDSDYYKFALHWNFPQAYYSVYLAMTAFHETQGLANDQHEKSIKLFGNSVKDSHYPKAMSFYSSGLHKAFEYEGFDTFTKFSAEFSPLRRIDSLDEAEMQLANFLKTTREKNAKDKRKRLEKANDNRFHNARKKFRKTFDKKHWDIIYQTIPVTSVFNLLYRLRIKANYRDIESFINADIDFKEFHSCLGDLIYYINFVHEAYIAKAIGIEKYEVILNQFPNHLSKQTALKRFEDHIKPLY